MSVNVGACGIYCEYCPTYRRKEYRCLGCGWANEKLRKFRESHKGCEFWECSEEKKLSCCLLCEEFPCKLHYGKEGAYTSKALDM